MYHSLYRNKETAEIELEQKELFKELEHNSIMDTFLALYHEEIRKALE